MLVSRAARCLALLLVLTSLAGCGRTTLVIGLGPGDQALEKTVLETDAGSRGDQVAVIDVSGLIMNRKKAGLLREGENPVSLLHERLIAAREDSHVKAVILRINSPGGTVTASDVMFREVRRFQAQSGKPVVALLMDVAASGGYYVACSADTIVTHPTSITGSIGVILQTISVQPALASIGVRSDAIVSGPNKDAGSPLSELRPEQRAILQQLVNDFYARFTDTVRTNRPLIPSSRFDEVTDGRVVSGVQAVKLGLADEVGDLYTAFDRAKILAGLDKADLVIHHRPLNYVASPYAAAPTAVPEIATQINLAQVNLPGMLSDDAPVGIYYLWSPTTP